jgi:diaminopimelate epimerase
MTLPFTKMHGCGNDYVVLNGFQHEIPDPVDLARRMTDRRYGVGADGLLLALPSAEADLSMRMFNVDGSEAEMCGNGLRCLVKFAWERGLVGRRLQGKVETGAGVLGYEITPDSARENAYVERVTVDMGRPRFRRNEDLAVGDLTLRVTALSMGNPHAVSWVEDVETFPVEHVGPLVEHHPAFPRRTNVEFVQVLSPDEARSRVVRAARSWCTCGAVTCVSPTVRMGSFA